MNGLLEKITEINTVVNTFIWAKVGIYILLAAGIFTSFNTGFFQVTHFTHWIKETVGKIFEKGSSTRKSRDRSSISQFQALCTALSATVGTGNISGVAIAIILGGPGAVFWMWIAAFFGMMTNYSENVLGIYYRRKDSAGEWKGGAMYYLRDGLGSKEGLAVPGKILAVFFSVFTLFAAFGIGNLSQINNIVLNINSVLFTGNSDGVPLFMGVALTRWIIGIVLMLVAGLIIIGGLHRIAAFAEKVIPAMSVLYIIGCLSILILNMDKIGTIFYSIFRFAFGVKAAAGGAAGIVFKSVITQGCKKGTFSNEAGLGSSVMVHSASDVREPVVQGMWGIFEVFFDTIVICTMTAVVVLSSGAVNLETGAVAAGIDGTTLVADTFGAYFGYPGKLFIAVAILFFAFTTMLGWSQYSSVAFAYLFGEKSIKYFRIIFTTAIVIGAVIDSSLAWDISETFNGFMMIPNLIGVLILSPLVKKITRSYVDRKIKGKDSPMYLSYDPEIQKAHENDIRNGIR